MGLIEDRKYEKLRDGRLDSLANHRTKLSEYVAVKTAMLAIVEGFDSAIVGNKTAINANQMVKDIRKIYTKYISDATLSIAGETDAINGIKTLIANDVVTPYTEEEKAEIAAIEV